MEENEKEFNPAQAFADELVILLNRYSRELPQGLVIQIFEEVMENATEDDNG